MLQGRQRYIQYLRGLLAGHLPVPGIVEGKITLGYGSPLPALILGESVPRFEIPPPTASVCDSFGHQRPAYRGLLGHVWARAMCRGWQPANPDILQSWFVDLAARIDVKHLPAGPVSAVHGFELCQQAWFALAVYSGGIALERPAWTQLGHQVFEALLRIGASSTVGNSAMPGPHSSPVGEAGWGYTSPTKPVANVPTSTPRGTFMTTGMDDNLESWWHHELVLLHAATSYAAPRRDPRWQSFLQKSAEHHFAETQPDHASTQPWGISAFLLFPHTISLADQMIHAAVVQGGGHPEAVSMLLFADALNCRERAG